MKDETAGDPITGLKWTRKTSEKLADELHAFGIDVSARTVCRLLKKLKFSLRVNRKQLSNCTAPPEQRNQQFENIALIRQNCARTGTPLISIDTKKKEKIGRFKNDGTTWRHKDRPVNDHDFPSLATGSFVPYGIHDLLANRASVFAGTNYDTPAFAVENIKRWWRYTGQYTYVGKNHLTILADGGGSNSHRSRAWKYHLQHKLCDPYNLTVSVAHYPPGCSKWNPVERQLFSRISSNWKGVPLETYETALNYIRTTQTKTGLQVKAYLVRKQYQKGEKISDEEMAQLNLIKSETLPKWNYTLHPST
jgi:hypothetical protein